MPSEMSLAVWVTAGPNRAISSSIETIVRCTARLSAASTSPECVDRRRDRSQPVGQLLVVHGDACDPDPLQLLAERSGICDRVRSAGGNSICAMMSSRRSSGRKARIAFPIAVQYAGRRAPTWRLRSISRWPGWAVRQRSMYTTSVPSRIARLTVCPVSSLSRRRCGAEIRAHVHRVDRGEAEVEHLRAEPVALRVGVLAAGTSCASVAM